MTDSSQPLREALRLLLSATDHIEANRHLMTVRQKGYDALAAALEGEQVPVGWKLTDEMVEVAARALFESGYMININSMPWDSESLGERERAQWREGARAALEAVRAMLSSAPASPDKTQTPIKGD